MTDFLLLNRLLLPVVTVVQLDSLNFLRFLLTTFSFPPPSFLTRGSSRVRFVPAELGTKPVAGFEPDVHRLATITGAEPLPPFVPEALVLVNLWVAVAPLPLAAVLAGVVSRGLLLAVVPSL